jgi:TonB-dependent starch-binding outer membrane protein SusC
MNLKIKPLILLIFLLSVSIAKIFAQGTAVSGRVTSRAEGTSLPGVNIVIKGTITGTATDADGKFKLVVPNPLTAVLIFSSIGFLVEEVALEGKTLLDVTLESDVKTLGEIVVVGYGEVKKSDLTGSVSSIKGDEITAFPTTNVVQALAGRTAGVQVIQNNGSPGGGVSVRIRGTNSIQGSNEPLYVVDGFPFSGNPNLLNNADIESIEVLKDASATAIYGSRGANGVVLITTKQGKAGKVQVDYDFNYSTQTLRKKLDLMNAQEYANFYNLQATNDKLAPYFTQDQINGFANNSFDWQSLVFQKAPIINHNLTVSGGSEKTKFSISGSTFNQEGIVIGSSFKRYSIRANFNQQISNKFSLTYGATLSQIVNDRRNSSGGNRGGDMLSGAISAPPTLTPYNDDGTYRFLPGAYPFISNVLINPLNFINEQTDRLKSNQVLANMALNYKILPSLTLRISGGIENRDNRTDAYTTRNFVNSQGVASVSTTQYTSLLNENTLTYAKTFKEKHSINALAGFTYQDFLNTDLSAAGTGFISDASQTYDIGAAITPGVPQSGYSKATLLSYLGRVNYSYNSKYLFTLSFRTDGSSRYSEGNKWGYFPSGALAWRASEEEFIKKIDFISDLKVRASYGATGSQAIAPYATLNQLGSGKTVFGDALYTFYAPGTRRPGNLKWETTEQVDFGLDFGILQDRFHLTADYYIKTTRDLLNTVQLPTSLGFTNTIQNIGSIQNKGLELTLDAKVLTGAFRWDLSGNISFNRNKVLKLYNGQDILGEPINISAVNDVISILREGQPLGMFFGYVEKGYDDNGKILYQDLNGDNAINALDKTFIGNPNPNFIYGLNSTMAYKGFEFTLFIQGSQGNDIFNLSSVGQTLDYGFGLNMPRTVLDNWTPANRNVAYPIISRSTSTNISNRFVEDGSYLRLRTIQLGYNFPMEKLGISWVRRLEVYASGQNLLTLTKYSWWDPEINSYGGSNSIRQGIDHYSYPQAKTVTFGLRVGF